MAVRTKQAGPLPEYIPVDDAERIAQSAAGRALASFPEYGDYDEPVADPDEVALENVLSELGSSGADAKVNVYQLDAKRNRAFVGSFLPGDFSIEQIQLRYGAGEYAVEVRKDKKWLKKSTVRIAAPRESVSSPAQQTAIDQSKIMEAMQSGFERMGAMFANALSGFAVNQPKPKTAMETLQELAMMRDLMGFDRHQPAPAQNPMEIIELAKTLAETITPRTGDPGTGEVIIETLKHIGPMLMQAQRAMPATPQALAPVLQQNPIPQNPVIDPAIETAQDDNEMSIQRKIFLGLLIRNAAANNDPETYANLLLDQASEEQIIEFAHRPDWFELLCREAPQAAPYRPWFEELRLIVLDLTKPETDDKTEGVELSDDTPNVPGSTDKHASSNP